MIIELSLHCVNDPKAVIKPYTYPKVLFISQLPWSILEVPDTLNGNLRFGDISSRRIEEDMTDTFEVLFLDRSMGCISGVILSRD